MGRRSSGHVFMPDLYVFPGGRRDPDDRSLPFSRDLHPLVHDKLSGKGTRALRPAQTRALALAAVRELHEETGLRMMVSPAATIADAQQPPDLSCLRYVARAITPPGQIRRFDTRFFCTFTDESGIDIRQTCDSPELVDLQWLDMADVSGLNMPAITRTVLEDVTKFMIGDPSLPFGNPVPFYFTRYGRFIRECV
jgi:8-oxo-dGTP pyrophosphatase MutT (NUDIX family)